MKKNIFLLMGCMILALACKKGEEDSESPFIHIQSPVSGSEWNQSDSVFIKVVIEDPDLHEYQISIVYGSELSYDFKTHTHDTKVEFVRSWYPDHKGEHLMRVQAADHSGNKDAKEVSFNIQ